MDLQKSGTELSIWIFCPLVQTPNAGWLSVKTSVKEAGMCRGMEIPDNITTLSAAEKNKWQPS